MVKKSIFFECMFSPFNKIALLFLISLLSLSTAALADPQKETQEYCLVPLLNAEEALDTAIHAEDYAAFLNTLDPKEAALHYDTKMGTDFSSATLERQETLSGIQYLVIAGKEKAPVCYLSQRDASYFYSWYYPLNEKS